MRMDDWPLDKIMRLPEFVFGRRFVVSCVPISPIEGYGWDISEVALPETCVIWELVIQPLGLITGDERLRIALGVQLPTSHAQFMLLEPLFNGLGYQGPGPRGIASNRYFGIALRMLRLQVHAAGRKLVCEMGPGAAAEMSMNVMIVVSSVPKEVPDWLFSETVRNL